MSHIKELGRKYKYRMVQLTTIGFIIPKCCKCNGEKTNYYDNIYYTSIGILCPQCIYRMEISDPDFAVGLGVTHVA